jgi:hypothetical protein
MADQTAETSQQADAAQGAFSGVVIGLLVGFNNEQIPLVAFPGNPEETAITARSTAVLATDDVGREVALLFEGGDPERPILIGPIRHPVKAKEILQENPATAEIDGERIVLSAKNEIVLKCGKASITLTKAGRVLIRGDYVLSRSSGVNRVKGGVVHIN